MIMMGSPLSAKHFQLFISPAHQHALSPALTRLKRGLSSRTNARHLLTVHIMAPPQLPPSFTVDKAPVSLLRQYVRRFISSQEGRRLMSQLQRIDRSWQLIHRYGIKQLPSLVIDGQPPVQGINTIRKLLSSTYLP